MRIAYIADFSACRYPSVGKKVFTQAELWQRAGHEVKVFVISPCYASFLDEVFPSVYRKIYIASLGHLPSPALRAYMAKWLRFSFVKRDLQKWQPDLIYWRESVWYPGWFALPGIAPVVVEVNSILEGELVGFKRLFYLMTRKLVNHRVSGFVTVTPEMASHYRRWGKAIEVVTNGYLLDNTRPRKPPRNDRPQLVFVGTPHLRWHGTDKVLEMARCLPEFDFHLIGPSSSDLEELPNLFIHGYIANPALASWYRTMDIGIGTLALYRNNMQEACPLKVREYLAWGLPVVIGYRDPDLDDAEYVLRLPNKPSGIIESLPRVVKFVHKWWGKEIPHDDVYRRIDMRSKEEKRLKFFERVLKLDFRQREANANPCGAG